jgi:hypothetical protein
MRGRSCAGVTSSSLLVKGTEEGEERGEEGRIGSEAEVAAAGALKLLHLEGTRPGQRGMRHMGRVYRTRLLLLLLHQTLRLATLLQHRLSLVERAECAPAQLRVWAVMPRAALGAPTLPLWAAPDGVGRPLSPCCVQTWRLAWLQRWPGAL